jgi:F0F1-type ATP synthase membrane subunit b/b'
LHFEKIIGENAMFLQQDLRLTTSQLNEFMKTEITSVLKEEFSKYEESINDAKQLAIDSIQKTQTTIEQQRELLTQQLNAQLNSEKARSLERFETHMADIVNHYVLEAVGEQIDMSEQLDFILAQMERNKEAIMKDVKDGA